MMMPFGPRAAPASLLGCLQVFLPGESQGQRSLVGCRLWGRTESDTAEATEQQQQQASDTPVAPVHASICLVMMFSSHGLNTVSERLLHNNLLPRKARRWEVQWLEHRPPLRFWGHV